MVAASGVLMDRRLVKRITGGNLRCLFGQFRVFRLTCGASGWYAGGGVWRSAALPAFCAPFSVLRSGLHDASGRLLDHDGDRQQQRLGCGSLSYCAHLLPACFAAQSSLTMR